MKYSVDGGENWHEAKEGVRIIYNDQLAPVEGGGEYEPAELHVNATEEGLILDVWVSKKDYLDHCSGTSSEMSGDIIERLVGGER